MTFWKALQNKQHFKWQKQLSNYKRDAIESPVYLSAWLPLRYPNQPLLSLFPRGRRGKSLILAEL